MSEGRWRISVTAPDWGQDHLSLDAIVAYVDDELAEGPYLRATKHLAQCRECAAQVVAQGQARAALRSAGCPSLPSSLMSSLRAIPQDTDLPAPPAGLAVTADGRLVSVLRPERAGGFAPEAAVHPASAHATSAHPTAAPPTATLAAEPPAGTAGDHQVVTRPHGRRPYRRLRVGTGVAVSGLALGAIALGVPAAISDAPPTPTPASSNGVLGGPVLDGTPNVVDAQLRLPVASRPQQFSGSAVLPSLDGLDAIPGSFHGIVP